jgi:alkanesulfonate monooxygenase SsuD/methylene tetrahydromethanopterin reductase-like flavin-dependent oxidoreductase (luciferase family)
MRYGFVLPYGDARAAAELAHEAEQAGWDGFFVWEPVWGIDGWVCLTAGASGTSPRRRSASASMGGR